MKPEASHTAHLRRVDLLYRRLKSGECDAAEVEWLAILTWQSAVFRFDRRSGYVAAERLSAVLDRAALRAGAAEDVSGDLLFRLAGRVLTAARAVSHDLKSKLVREHAEIKLHAVREFDSKSLVALSRQRGRTVREKLADRATVLAPRRIWTFDTVENRLFRALCVRLVPLLALRHENEQLQDPQTAALMEVMQRWLRSDVSSEIGSLQAFTPNNILLQDPNYRPVWDAWRTLQAMDARFEADLTDTGTEARGLDRMMVAMMLVELASRLARRADMFLLEQPVRADSDLHRVLSLADDPLSATFWWSGQRGAQIEIALIEGTPPSLVVTVQVSGEDKVADYLVSIDNAFQAARIGSVVSVKEWSQAFAEELFGGASEHERRADDGPSLDGGTDSLSAVDLCEVTPSSTSEAEPEQLRRFSPLIWQSWEAAGSRIGLDLGDARGFRLDDGVLTRSMLDAFRNAKEELDDGSWIEQFSEALRAQIGPGWVTYLVPDSASEFCWRRLRRAMQTQYSGGRSRPVPRSVGLAADAASQSNGFTRESAFVVIDGAGDSVSVTRIAINPVKPGLAKRVRATPLHGVRLERHPPIILASACSDTGFGKTRLAPGDPAGGEQVANLLGWSGVETLGPRMMIKTSKQWVSPSGCFSPNGKTLDGAPGELRKTIEDAVNEARRSGASEVAVIFEPRTLSRIRLLGWEKLVVQPFDTGGPVRVIAAEPVSAVRGALAAALAERELGEPIWTNHLPKLAIRDDSRTLIYLVSGKKGQALVPRFGKRELVSEIAIQLSPGRSSFTFPLVQGESDQETGYLCTLESPDFPLSQPERHKFRLFYEYGAENPYTLECASSKHLRTFWKSGEPELLNAFPGFPNLALEPDEAGRVADEALDLLWCACGAPQYEARLSSGRRGQDDNQYVFAVLSEDNQSVFLHRGSFVDSDDFDLLEVGDSIWIGWLKSGDKGLKGLFVLSDDSVLDLDSKEAAFARKKMYWGRPLQVELKTRLRKISTGSNSLIGHLSDERKTEVRKVGLHLAKRGMTSSNGLEVGFILASLHSTAPRELGEWLVGLLQSGKGNTAAFGVALGNLDCDWQMTVLEEIFERFRVQSNKFEWSLLGELGVAVWRSESLVHQFSADNVDLLLEQLMTALKQDSLDLQAAPLAASKGRNDKLVPWNFVQRLTLLLGLLRLRSSNNPRIASKLKVGSVACRDFLSVVDELSHQLESLLRSQSAEIVRKALRTFIKLELPPEPVRSLRPEIIRALQIYLSGADEASGVLVSVEEVED